MSEEKAATEIFDRLRQTQWAADALDIRPIGIDTDYSMMELKGQAYEQLSRVYGLSALKARSAYWRDKAFLTRVLTETAQELGERSEAMMEAVRGRLSSEYLLGAVNRFDPGGEVPPLTGLARSLATYTVACSDAPYPYLEEDRNALSELPGLPPVDSNLPAGVPDTPPPADLQEMRDAGVPEPESGWYVRLPEDWRGWDVTRNGDVRFAMDAYGVHSDEQLRLATLSRDARPPPHDADYNGHPIALLAGHFLSPRDLYFQLRLPPDDRNEYLRILAKKIDRYLLGGQREFRTAFRERDWETLRPLLESAKWTLFPNVQAKKGGSGLAGPDAALHRLCNKIIEDLEGWTISDSIMAITIVASIALTLVSVGVAAPIAAAALRATATVVDVVGVAADLLVADAENRQRARINRFAAIDTALDVAARPEDLEARAAIGALSLLIPFALPAAIKSVRGSFLGRVLQRIPKGEFPGSVARAAQHGATAVPVPPGGAALRRETKAAAAVPKPSPAAVRPARGATAQATGAEARAIGSEAKATANPATGKAEAASQTARGTPRPEPGAPGKSPTAKAGSGGGKDGAMSANTKGGGAKGGGAKGGGKKSGAEGGKEGSKKGGPTSAQRTARGIKKPASGRPPVGHAPEFVPNPPGGKAAIDAATITDQLHRIMDDATIKRLNYFDRLIAGTGGIRKIVAGYTADLRRAVRIEGEILTRRLLRRSGKLHPGQTRAPNFNSRARSPDVSGPINKLRAKLNDSRVTLGAHWQRLHLWGPGFGDEAAAGMMLGPRSVNLEWQASGVEAQIRGLSETVRSMGGRMRLIATAEAWGARTPAGFAIESGEEMLHSAQYQLWAELPGGKRTTSMFIDVTVPDPGDIVSALRAGSRPPKPVVKVTGDLDL